MAHPSFCLMRLPSAENTQPDVSFSRKRLPNLGTREEREKQKELELDFIENEVFSLPHLELLTEPARKKEYKNNELFFNKNSKTLLYNLIFMPKELSINNTPNIIMEQFMIIVLFSMFINCSSCK